MALLNVVKFKYRRCSDLKLIIKLFDQRNGLKRESFCTSRRLFYLNPKSYAEKLVKKDVSGKLPPAYIPRNVEDQWYEWWEQQGYFKLRSTSRNSKPFTMILPPPNVTGTLHLGHALTVTVQDVLARWRRMLGQEVLWVPGTDHAGIATQVVVEKHLWANRNMTRHQLGTEEFLAEVTQWQKQKGSHIRDQLRRLGATVDWSREYFTMDREHNEAVIEAFTRLFDAGLIYRSTTPVNWSCWLQSTISDVEVDTLEVTGPTLVPVPGYEKPIQFGLLFNIAYKLSEQEGEVVVSTTRPETLLGDVALAVHPSDNRYSHLHGSFALHPYRKEKIPIICDEFVDPTFGTGAVKITPAHDRLDFDVARRHNLKTVPVINEEGLVQGNFGQFEGMKRFEVRENLCDDLASRGLLRGTFAHSMSVPICSRSGDVVEFLLKPQWFMNTKELGKRAEDAVREGTLRLLPKELQKNWFLWFEDHRDWCLSRQIWWGHRIPAYECQMPRDENVVWVAAKSKSEARTKAAQLLNCNEKAQDLIIKQDEDVLDTWFSSSILPFSTFGWPHKAHDLQRLYPLSLMETGHDILLFWVARMVMMGLQLTGQLPFRDVLLHGVICDALGRKMSKSIGNVVSPEDVRDGVSLEKLMELVETSFKGGAVSASEKETARKGQMELFPNGIPACGTDALRFTLCSRNIQNRFITFSVDECYSNRLFCNKIWNASHFIERALEQVGSLASLKSMQHDVLRTMDLWILSELSALISNLDQSLRNMDFGSCTLALRTFAYNNFCDIYIESTKPVLKYGSPSERETTVCILVTCLRTFLEALSPFMPFLSEELFHRLPGRPPNIDSVMLVPYPSPDMWLKWRNIPLESEIATVIAVVSSVRHLKKVNGIPNKSKVSVLIESKESDQLKGHSQIIQYLAICDKVDVCAASSSTTKLQSTEQRLTDGTSVRILTENADSKNLSKKGKESIILAALRKLLNLRADINKIQRNIEAPEFRSKAPPHVQKAQSDKLSILNEEVNILQALLNEEPELTCELKKQVEQEGADKRRKKQEKKKKDKRAQ